LSGESIPGAAVRGKGRWRDTLAVYRDRRILLIALMGFSSGLPLLLTLSTLSYWLAKRGIDRTSIGLFALVGAPYSFKFLWAPLLDQLPAPFLGRRRGWALTIQAAMAVSILAMGFTDPVADAWLTALVALAVAFLSASQDIVLDAFRIELLPQTDAEQGASSTVYQLGYRIGMLVANAGAIAVADFVSWPWVFAGLAALTSVGMAAVIMAPELPMPARRRQSMKAWFLEGVVAPLSEFTHRHGWWVILLFVLLYKLAGAVGTSMSSPFYIGLGFSGVEIAAISKVFGMAAFMAGAVIGGIIAIRFGIMRALFLGGVLQALGILMFAVLSYKGHDRLWLALAIGSENLVDGVGSAAFVAYLSELTNIAFTATQYALLSSLTAWGRTLLSSGGGWLSLHLGWPLFFVFSSALAVPGLLLLLWLSRIYPTRRADVEAKLA